MFPFHQHDVAMYVSNSLTQLINRSILLHFPFFCGYELMTITTIVIIIMMIRIEANHEQFSVEFQSRLCFRWDFTCSLSTINHSKSEQTDCIYL